MNKFIIRKLRNIFNLQETFNIYFVITNKLFTFIHYYKIYNSFNISNMHICFGYFMSLCIRYKFHIEIFHKCISIHGPSYKIWKSLGRQFTSRESQRNTTFLSSSTNGVKFTINKQFPISISFDKILSKFLRNLHNWQTSINYFHLSLK